MEFVHFLLNLIYHSLLISSHSFLRSTHQGEKQSRYHALKCVHGSWQGPLGSLHARTIFLSPSCRGDVIASLMTLQNLLQDSDAGHTVGHAGHAGHAGPSPKFARPRWVCTTVVVALTQTPTATHATSRCVRVNICGRRRSSSSAAPRSMESYAVIVATRRGVNC